MRAALSPNKVQLAAAVLAALANSAPAATIDVADAAAAASATSCTIVDALASLNAGVLQATCANASNEPFGTNDTISLSPGLPAITFTGAPPGMGYALTAQHTLQIRGVVDGKGKPTATIQRSTATGVPAFGLIGARGSLTLTGVILTGGAANYSGGAVNAGLSVTLNNSVVSGNSAQWGGAIANCWYNVELNNSTVTGNSALSNGGGIFAGFCYHGDAGHIAPFNANIVATNSTISGNVAHGQGGGVYTPTSFYCTNSTISGNKAYRTETGYASGGGVLANGFAMDFCTITNNYVDAGSGGGVTALDLGATLSASATLISGNHPTDLYSDSWPSWMAGDHNLIGSYSHNLILTSPALTCDPILSDLGDNGGPTATHALLIGSCAIDAGPISAPLGITTDQRGQVRAVGLATDIGAFEKQGPEDPPNTIFVDSFE